MIAVIVCVEISRNIFLNKKTTTKNENPLFPLRGQQNFKFKKNLQKKTLLSNSPNLPTILAGMGEIVCNVTSLQ